MSSSEDEIYDVDAISDASNDSGGFEPTPKKKPAKAATKAAPKSKGAEKATRAKAPAKPKSTAAKASSSKKIFADHDENADSDGAMDVDGDVPSTNKSAPVATANSKKKSASETYTKLSQIEHILVRPDSYIGSVEEIQQSMWVYDADTKRMVNREVKYVPGFFKIIDEILVNAADNKVNDPNMDTLKVDIDPEAGTISVYNNGHGIPIEIHSKEKIYIPELIFGHLLSSSNYDDDEKKLTGGRNGFGAKLANIYSHEFTLETADRNSGQKYKQTWTENMSKMGKAKITKNAKDEEFTRVTFRPDLARFGMESIDGDALALLHRRVYDLAGTVKDVKVFLNGKRVPVKNFKSYVDLYIDSATQTAAEASGGAAQAKPTVVYEKVAGTNDRWEVAFAVSESGNFQHVSFANSIATTKGGTHVAFIADQITKGLIAQIEKKNKGAKVKPASIKNHMWIFVNSMIENPAFDSQTKEYLNLPAGKFGSKPKLSEEFMKKISKSSIIDHVLNWAKFKADQEIKKTDGSKRNRLSGLPKLADANNAGTRHASHCTLILTEGDSAKSLAVAGLGVVGRDNFGVFPLRGKLLNVREAKHDQIMKNEEIQNIKKIMGLQHNKEYTSTTSLRYGRLMIMTDQDHDGSHIKGLLINFLDHFYPSLLKIPEFLVEFVTPIVRVWKKKNPNKKINFFTIPEYEQWAEECPDIHNWDFKYYKGLGTSKDSDAREYFSDMAKHMIPFSTTQDGDRELIDLAFSKKKADDRKEWLRNFVPGTYLNHNIDEIPYSDFINKELILFSMADNIRSIPSAADGLKPGQRKVIWACFKKKMKKEIKVAQLVGYISEVAAYHHGEQSLSMTIVNLAQDYVGSNNLNLLMPNGQYGTRDQGGKDHASPRYIFTEPAPIARAVFHPSDDPLLNTLKEDNDLIEPEYYVPVVPLVLVNGAEGIGTGWSTSVPCYNPVDIVANIRRVMAGEEQVPMTPWWRGFKGTIKKVSEHKYDVQGVARKINDTTVEITELPIHKWTQNYKAELEAMCGEKGDGVIKDYKEHSDNVNVHIVVTMSAKDLEKAEEQGLEDFFKLTSKINTSNMICFDFDGKIKKYHSPEEIIEDFYPVRLALYQKRKDFLANELQLQFDRLSNQARFVRMIVAKELSVSNRKKADIVSELREKKFRPFPKVAKAKAAGETEEVVEDEEEEQIGADSDYDYLLGMAIWSLTKEKIEKLEAQAADKEAELMELLKKTPVDLWTTDLDKFTEEWEANCREWEMKAVVDASGKKPKKKQATLKTRLSLTGGKKGKLIDSDDEDDYKPTKAAAKKAPAKPKPTAVVPSSSSVKVDEDADMKPPPAPAAKKRAPAKKVVKDESDDEPPKKHTLSKKAATKNESELDEPVIPTKPARTLKKKPQYIDDDDEPPSDVKGKGKAKPALSDSEEGVLPVKKARAPAKRKSPEIDIQDSDDESAPAKKKRAAPSGALTDFFDKVPKKPAPTARKASSSKPPPKKAAAKSKVAESDNDDSIMDDDAPAVVPARSAPARAARATTKKPAYIDIDSDIEQDYDGSSFAMDDD